MLGLLAEKAAVGGDAELLAVGSDLTGGRDLAGSLESTVGQLAKLRGPGTLFRGDLLSEFQGAVGDLGVAAVRPGRGRRPRVRAGGGATQDGAAGFRGSRPIGHCGSLSSSAVGSADPTFRCRSSMARAGSMPARSIRRSRTARSTIPHDRRGSFRRAILL